MHLFFFLLVPSLRKQTFSRGTWLARLVEHAALILGLGVEIA